MRTRVVEFLQELRQRRVYHAAVVYVALAFALLQFIDLLAEALSLPDWTLPLAGLTAVLGFVPALLLSWAFDLGPAELRPMHSGTAPVTHARPFRLAMAGAIVLGLIGAALFTSRRSYAVGRPAATIAVLPFRTPGDATDEGYLGDGIAEDLLTSLARVDGLRVISRSSVMAYRDTQKDAREIGAELGAGWLLEGSVRRSADRLRICARLVDARTGRSLWADTYDGVPADLFAVQSRIAERIAGALRLQLTAEVQARFAQSPTTNPAAHDLALRARAYFNRFDRESNELAIQFARQAIALDPGYALGHALLGSAFANRMRFGGGPEWGDSALAAGQRAILLDPEMGDGFRTLGVAYFRRGRYPEALQAYERAVQLNPSDQRALASAGAIHSVQGHPLEALDWTRRAIGVDPRSPDTPLLLQNLVAIYLDVNLPQHAQRALERARDLDPLHPKLAVLAVEIALRRGDGQAAIALADTLLRNAPTDPYPHVLGGDAHLFAGDREGARRLYRRAYRLAPLTEGIRHYAPVLLAWTLLQDGEEGEAVRLLDSFEQFALDEIAEGSENYTLFLSMAASRAMRGDAETALDWLERANAAAGVALEWAMQEDPLLESIRATPRFRRMRGAVTDSASVLRGAVLARTDGSALGPAGIVSRLSLR